MQTQISYNQYVRTTNPIDVTSAFLSVLPNEQIEVKNYTHSDGSTSTHYGKYESSMWKKFLKDIELNGIREFLTLQLTKNEFGINEFHIKDGLHRLYAIRQLKRECKIPVMIEIDTKIPFDELRDLFNMLTESKIISNRDYASLLNQFVLLQLSEITHGFWNLLNEKDIKVSNRYNGNKIDNFIELLKTNKIKAYIKSDGIDFSWTFKNGKIVFKFEDGDEVFDVSKKYPINSINSDGDIISAATKAIYQLFERLSPTTMRALGLFSGNWIDSTIIYGEIQSILPYNAMENYIRLNNIVTENGVFIKDGRQFLKEVSNLIGDIVVTSEVVEYEGSNLNNIKYYTKNKSSVWKISAPNEIKESDLLTFINEMIILWKQSSEYKRILANEYNENDVSLLFNKINADLSSKLRLKDNEIIQFIDTDGVPLQLISSLKKKQINIINISKKLYNDLTNYIARDILGLSTNKIGMEYSTRFGSNALEYLQTKSIKFSKKTWNPNEFLNVSIIMEKINIMIEELQRLDFEANNLLGIERDKANKFIKNIAYNTMRLKSSLQKVKNYVDLMKAYAEHQLLFKEEISPIKIKLNQI